MFSLYFIHITRNRIQVPFIILFIFFSPLFLNFIYYFIIIFPFIFLLSKITQRKKFNDNSEFYHLLAGNNYTNLLISKTFALAIHINIQYVLFVVGISIFKYFYKEEIVSPMSLLNSFFVFNSGLFIAFTLGDLVRFSDINQISALPKLILSYIVFLFSFQFCFSFILLFSWFSNENILLQFFVLLICITAWYFHCMRFKQIRYKQIIIPSVYDKD